MRFESSATYIQVHRTKSQVHGVTHLWLHNQTLPAVGLGRLVNLSSPLPDRAWLEESHAAGRAISCPSLCNRQEPESKKSEREREKYKRLCCSNVELAIGASSFRYSRSPPSVCLSVCLPLSSFCPSVSLFRSAEFACSTLSDFHQTGPLSAGH